MVNEIGETRNVEVAGKTLHILESTDTIDPSMGRVLTGSWLWDSALHLSEWMATHPGIDLAGKTILELGAGTGLPGLTAALLGATGVVLTDQPLLLPGLRANTAGNALSDIVEVRELTWGSSPSGEPPPDIVLMSDVLYDPAEMAGLATTLRGVCGTETRIWAASEVREGVYGCLEVLAEEGFIVAEMTSGCRRLLRSPGETSEFAIFVISHPGERHAFGVRRNADEQADDHGPS